MVWSTVRDTSVGANALEIRMAHLEGAYQQIDKRLGSLERQVSDGFGQLRGELRDIRAEIRSEIRWLIGLIVVDWITVMLAIFNKH